jgi:uncharacterized protein YodC (DUF2158 family)
MESTFKIGDVVRIQSGGPAMTVEYLTDDYNVKCVWFNKRQKLKRGEFKTLILKFSDPTKVF